MVSQYPPRCPRCGSRLFRENESQGGRLHSFWECSLGCSRQWDDRGQEVSYLVDKQRVRVFREPVLVR